MPPPAGGQQPQGNNSLGPLWIVLGICVVGGLTWYFAHGYIVWAIFKIKYVEVALVSLVTDNLDPVKNMIQNLPPDDVTVKQLNYICDAIGRYYRFPFALILGFIGYKIYRSGCAGNYRTTYSMETLANKEQQNWPQIKPVLGLDLVHENIEKGPWAMAMRPMDFSKKNKLIIEEEIPQLEGELRRRKRFAAKLDRGKANALFALQLGPLWHGYKKLKMHSRAMFVAFAARINGDRKVCDDLLVQLSLGFDGKTNGNNYQGVDELCEKYINTKVVKRILEVHGYELTVFPAMLEAARNVDGVFPCSDFIWIKPVDRKLWLILNTVGRQTPCVEVAGVFAHFIVEKELERKVGVPMVEAATDALEIALTEIVYKRDDE